MPKVKTTGVAKENRPPLTPEAWENRMIAKAYTLVEKRLDEGTASSQETTHFLKLGSSKAQLEMKKLEMENALTQAKTEAIQSQKNMEELYSKAISAMRDYGGKGGEDYEYEEDY